MNLLVRIIAKDPVRYSLDNGITVTEYEPGEVYTVPEFAGVNMIRRAWAVPVKAEDLDKPEVELDEPIDLDLADLRQPKAKKKESSK
jgi:hypothetical protein